MRHRLLLPLVLAAATACSGDQPPEEAGSQASAAVQSEPRVVRFTATDFAFEGPREIEAGTITFVLENHGETWHHLQLIRLPEDMTFEQFQEGLSQMQPGSPPPPWMVDAGGVNPPPDGGEARATTTLEAGEYVALCFVDTPDKIPHVMKGMLQPLTVTESSSAPAELPPADLTLTLVDYAFSFDAPPTAGSHTIRVVNEAEQSHEVAFFRFLPGKTMDDLLAWAPTFEGPAPMTPVGGVPGFRPGQVVDVEVDFEPGSYVALCFVPDHNDGMPHIEHGMALPFEVS